MKYMTENEILELVQEYIANQNAEYAILIDGEWGSGKTYFVEHKLIEELEKKNKNEIEEFKKIQEKNKDENKNEDKNIPEEPKEVRFIYLSLYGIKDTVKIDEMLYYKIMEYNLPKKFKNIIEKCEKGLKNIYDVIKAINRNLPDINISSVKNILKTIQKKERYVLIFDDLERCDLPINEILGYINDFVEHEKMKVIIVANQKEITKNRMLSNMELKYLIAQNQNINFPHKENSLAKYLNNTNKTNDNEKVNIDIPELRERVQMLFGEDLLYNQIKEKLIGNVIYYKPEIQIVLETILKKQVVDKDVRKYLLNNKKDILKLLETRNYYNLRTLQIAIEILEKIFMIMKKDGTLNKQGIYFDECRKRILEYTLIACIKNKQGEKTVSWGENSEYTSVSNGINNSYTAFKFIDEIIDTGFVNKEKIKEVINAYVEFESKNAEKIDDPLNKLKYYAELEDEEINKIIEEITEKLEKDGYTSDLYPRIILLFIRIKNIGFDKKIVEDMVKIMIKNVEKKGYIISKYDEFDLNFIDTEESNEYRSQINKIKSISNVKADKKNKNDINNIFNSEDEWGEEFRNYYFKNKEKIMNNRGFLKFIDIDNLARCLEKSKSKDINYFKRGLYSIYGFDNIKNYYSEDLENMIKLLEKLEDINLEKYGKTKKYNIEKLKKLLNEIIEKLK